ncbi:hypothetical protein [Sphaerisporangium rubeum]|uniref:Uncharacterized protein n=1 Tax=Sphaerisporangium rubeum TaxID=321317 RepID=A0A7X0IC67_9ACTN|nr:hypothetical protein [Sphaerisporangium rubeum]
MTDRSDRHLESWSEAGGTVPSAPPAVRPGFAGLLRKVIDVGWGRPL